MSQNDIPNPTIYEKIEILISRRRWNFLGEHSNRQNGGKALFFFATFLMLPRKNYHIFMPPGFIPLLKFLCHPFLCQPPIFKCLCHNCLCHLDYLCDSRKILNSVRYIFNTFSFWLPIFFVTFFLCHLQKN